MCIRDRAKKERTDEEYEEGNSIWNPFRERMREAQSWIHQHTAEHVSTVSYTHLDVYKRQVLQRGKGDFDILFHLVGGESAHGHHVPFPDGVPGEGEAHIGGCLLYTSRCV